MRVTRRELCAGTAALALAGAVFGARPGGFSFVLPAFADASEEEVMTPGPLGEQAQGDAKAPVTLIEYAAVTCPHCSDFFLHQFPEIKSKYIDTGKVHFIFREFPLNALDVAGFMLARCAGDNKYFPIVDTLFEKQREWVVQKPIEPLMAIAKQAGFTQQSFEACINDKEALAKVQQVRDRASDKFKVKATPTFFINGERREGGLSIEELDKILEPYLKT